MHKIEQAVDYAEELLESTRLRPERLLDSASSTSKWKTIYQRLLDLYLEENKKEPKCLKLKCTSHLLDKLVLREHLNTLVVNLYPGNEGYSLMLKGRSGADSETMRLPYEESELLEYIDAEQLPPLLVDLLDRVQANIFYCGCVIAEIHDHRRTVNDSYDTQYVMLRPTSQTLLCDINAMTSSNSRWTQEDKFTLESQLLLHTNEPLCLDPSPAVFLVANNLHYHKHKFNHQILKRSVKKYSQTAINRKRKLAHCSAPKHLKLYEFLNRKKDKIKSSPAVNLKVGKTCVDMWRQRDVQLATPESIDVEKYAKAIEKPKTINDNTPVVVEEYTFETERSHGKVYFSRLTILQRLNEEFYHGQLYVDRDYVEAKSQGSTCKFPLGTKSNVEKYIRQFREIFTEEGRRQVKISHQVPGQRPTVSYTQNIHSIATSQPAASNQQANIITQATNLAATITGQLGLTSPGIDSTGKKAAPICLSLSLQPQIKVSASNASSAQGTPVTAQLTLNLPQQQLAAAQRLRQMNIYQGLQRSSSAGNSQASTPTTPAALTPITGTITAIQMSPAVKSNSSSKTSSATPTHTPTPTPPPSQGAPSQHAVITSTTGLRRLSAVEGLSHPLQLNISGSIVQALSSRHPQTVSAPPTPSSDTAGDLLTIKVSSATSGAANQSYITHDSVSGMHSGETPSATPPPNVNIANISTAPPNINIQNLAGLQGVNIAANIQGLQNIQNVQVSLGSVNLPGGIAVPITPGGIFVSSLPNVASSVSGNVSSTKVTGSTVVSSGASLVTMVTTVSTSRLSSSTESTTSALQGASTTTVMSSPSAGMLSVPINVAGNITQFMTTGIKGSSALRPGTPLLLSQISGQGGQQVQLLNAANLSRAQTVSLAAPTGSRSQGAALATPSAGRCQGGSLPTQSGTTSSKTGVVTAPTTTVLTAQNLAGQTSSISLPQLRQGQTQMLTAQQIVQLTSQQQLTQLALQQQKLQAISTSSTQPQKLTLQHIQQQKQLPQHFLQQKLSAQQLQQLRRSQAGAVLGAASSSSGHKSKSKKKSSSGSSPK